MSLAPDPLRYPAKFRVRSEGRAREEEGHHPVAHREKRRGQLEDLPEYGRAAVLRPADRRARHRERQPAAGRRVRAPVRGDRQVHDPLRQLPRLQAVRPGLRQNRKPHLRTDLPGRTSLLRNLRYPSPPLPRSFPETRAETAQSIGG